jgi:hypothetical protein
MSRKLSRVSADEMAELNKKLDEIFADFCEEGGGVTKASLQQLAKEGGLLDKNLKDGDVGLIFESTKLGKKKVRKYLEAHQNQALSSVTLLKDSLRLATQELNADRFFEAFRKMAVTKEVTFQELVQMCIGEEPTRTSVKMDKEADAALATTTAADGTVFDSALALSDDEFATKMGMDKAAYEAVGILFHCNLVNILKLLTFSLFTTAPRLEEVEVKKRKGTQLTSLTLLLEYSVNGSVRGAIQCC